MGSTLTTKEAFPVKQGSKRGERKALHETLAPVANYVYLRPISLCFQFHFPHKINHKRKIIPRLYHEHQPIIRQCIF